MFVQHITRTHHDYKQTTNRSKTVKSKCCLQATGLSSNSINRPMRSSITLRICHTQLYLLSLRWFV